MSRNGHPPLLEVDQLVTSYPLARGVVGTLARRPRQQVRAVDGVSFTLDDGELLALVGESGCGKTSTAQTIMRGIEPESGAIRVRGSDITKLGHRQLLPFRRVMQLIYQDPYEALDPRFTVRETLREPLAVHSLVSSSAERDRAVVEALERVGLTPPELYAGRFPHELSGGQRQRVAIAAALIVDPQLLVADEPVSMLDVSVRTGILRLLRDLRHSGLGIVMITHDLSTAAHFADRIAVMYLGRIVEEGPALEVVRNPQHPYTRALVAVAPRASRVRRRGEGIISGETPDPARLPTGCRFHPRCPVALPTCAHHDPALAPVTQGDAGHRAACVLADAELVGKVRETRTA